MTVRSSIHAAVWGHDWRAEALMPTLDAAARIGYDHVVVPLRDFSAVDPEALAAAFSQRGLVPLNTCGLSHDKDIGSTDASVRERGVAHLRHAVALARDMGSPQIGGVLYGPLGKAAEPANPEALRHTADCLRQVADTARKAGVRLALEVVNRYETAVLNTVTKALALLEAINHDAVALHVDTFHMSIEESDPLDALARAMPRLAYFELDQSHRGDAFDGSLDLVAWSRRASELGYDGIVGVEAFSRQRLAPDHANLLAIWEHRFDDGNQVAENFMRVIRNGFGR